MAVERGLGSWSRQIGFNMCVRLNDCCCTKPSCTYGLISALWLTRHYILLWVSYIQYICGSETSDFYCILYFNVPYLPVLNVPASQPGTNHVLVI